MMEFSPLFYNLGGNIFMSKIQRAYDEEFNIKDLINQKEKDYQNRKAQENITWGDRGDVLNIGKPMDKMLFHKGKKIASARMQVELMYNWLLQCEDRRTRVIGKAWFEEHEGVFDSMRDNPLFAEFFKPDDPADTVYIYKQRFYTYLKALKIMKKITEGRKSQYILTNPVYALPFEMKYDYGKRTLNRLTEMHVLYAELDHYKMEQWSSKTSKQMWKIVKKHLINHGFPLPTEVVFSRGLHMYWKHSPIPAFMVDEWRMLMGYLNKLLSKFGADVNAMDPVRILRAVGSIHEKTGEKITGLTFTDDRYDFMELFNKYCADEWALHLLKQAEDRKKRTKQLEEKWLEKQKWMFENGIIDEDGNFTEKYEPNRKQTRRTGRTKKIINADAKNHRFNKRHQNIVDGIFWLSDVVRKGNMKGCKELCCYIVRVMMLRITGGNKIESLRVMKELFDGFSPQVYTWNDIVERTKSAEMDYDRWLQNETLGVRYKTSTLIEKLKITPSEMAKMRFIVDETRGEELHLEADRLYQKRKHTEEMKAAGKLTNEEKKRKVLKYFKENPDASNVQASKDLKISRPTIIKYRPEN